MSESTLKDEEFQDETMMKADDDASKQEATASVISPKKLCQTNPVKLGKCDTSTVGSVNEGDDGHADNRVSSKHCDAFPELNLHGGSDRFIFIEACAGCGILSSVAKEQGFLVVPLDCPRNQHKTKVKVVTLDLTAPHADYLLRRLVQDYNVIAVHFGLPCGTCSKARGIPMAMVALGLNRSEIFPSCMDCQTYQTKIDSKLKQRMLCTNGLIHSYNCWTNLAYSVDTGEPKQFVGMGVARNGICFVTWNFRAPTSMCIWGHQKEKHWIFGER